jgi:hypothetical protein
MADTAARQASGEEAYHSVRKEGMITKQWKAWVKFRLSLDRRRHACLGLVLRPPIKTLIT